MNILRWNIQRTKVTTETIGISSFKQTFKLPESYNFKIQRNFFFSGNFSSFVVYKLFKEIRWIFGINIQFERVFESGTYRHTSKARIHTHTHGHRRRISNELVWVQRPFQPNTHNKPRRVHTHFVCRPCADSVNWKLFARLERGLFVRTQTVFSHTWIAFGSKVRITSQPSIHTHNSTLFSTFVLMR